MDSLPAVPWTRVTEFIRQHTHDVRNGLNSLELESAFLGELVTDAEAVTSVERIQKQLRSLAQQLKMLSASFQNPQPMASPIAASLLQQIWREKQVPLKNIPEVRWVNELKDEQIKVDIAMMATVFRELLINAEKFSHCTPITVHTKINADKVVFELIEPKTQEIDISNWGEPFFVSRRGGYGLGLWSARKMVHANGGEFNQNYCPISKCLHTQISFSIV